MILFTGTYNHSCEIGMLATQCSENEECVSRNSRARGGACLCDSKSYLSAQTGKCELTEAKGASTVKRMYIYTEYCVP